MMNNPAAFQDAVARAKEIAQKLTASAPNSLGGAPLKRPNSDDDFANKRPSFTSSTSSSSDVPSPVLRAQQIAQQINSQLGVKSTPGDPFSMPLSNQLTFQEDYKIPGRYVGLIIGKGGEQIIRLQAESGCKVQISQTRPEPSSADSGPPDRVANMSGTREALDRARRIMDDIIARGKAADGVGTGANAYSMGGSNYKSIEVMLPSAKCGLVIGKGGENIKRASEEFGIKMFVGQEITEIDGIEHKPLKLSGDSDKVERAKQYVLDSLTRSGGLPLPSRSGGSGSSMNDYGSRTGGAPMSGPCNEAVYHSPHDKAGVIIGKGGESIKEINRKSGAFVELDKSFIPAVGNSSDRLFKLRGTPEQIATAQQLMYEKVANSPGGPGDMLTPAQFQQQYNLPAVASSSTDPWAAGADSYGADANDPYSQWASAYAQWSQVNPYDANASTSNSSSTGADASGMDPAWLAYYQSMGYYGMMQGGTPGASTNTSKTSTATDSTASNNNSSTTSANNAAAGQPDYSQQWIEYYRSVGQNDVADQIAKQMKEIGSTTASTSSTSTMNSSVADATAAAQATAMMMSAASNPWAAYSQWANGANGAASTTATNGSSAPTAPSS